MKNSTEIIKAIAPLVVVLILGSFVAKFTLSKMGDQSVQIKKFQKENNTLNQKIKILGAISPSVQSDVNSVILALPESNSTLAVVSQLKNSAITNSVKLGNLKAGAEVKDPSGLSRADIAFEVEGPKPQIIAYLNSLSKVAPITIVEKVKLSEIDQVSRASVTVKAFWTAFPKTLPSFNEALADFTDKENQVITSVSNLTPPQFSSSVTDESASGRVDPFTQ